MRPRRPPFPAVAAGALLLLGACSDDRTRPAPFSTEGPAELGVEVLSPATNRTVPAGASLTVRIRGMEEDGRLVGVGYRAYRMGPERPPLDSALRLFEPLADTTLSFLLPVPDSLPHNAQIDVVGIALGPGGQRLESDPRGIIVIRCSPGSPAC